MYEIYKMLDKEECKRKTALGERKWLQQVQNILGDEGYKEEKRLMPDGTRKRRSCLALGWQVMV